MFEFFVPTRVLFGAGQVSNVGEQVRRYGQRAILVCGGSARKNGTLKMAKASLARAGVSFVVGQDVRPDPTDLEVDGIVELICKQKGEVIVAIGGGSVLDAAKAASVVVACEESCGPLVGKTLPINEASIPVVAVPTTAGTGAEITKGAIITDLSRGLKSGIRGEDVFPAVAIVDPDLLVTMPMEVMQETVFDTFTHLIESFVARKAQPLTEIISIRGLEIVAEFINEPCVDILDHRIREKMALAALMGGINVGLASSCLPHRLQQAMSGVKEISCSHGRGIALIYRAWLTYAVEHSPEKFGTVSGIFNCATIFDAVEKILRRLNLTRRLSDVGYQRSHIDMFLSNITGNLENDPIPNIGEDLIQSIYQASY